MRSLHTQAEVISSEQQPLLLPCLSLSTFSFKAGLQTQGSHSQALPKKQSAAAMQGSTFKWQSGILITAASLL